MDTRINTTVAKSAGLQIDTLQMMQSSQTPLRQLERFNNHSIDNGVVSFENWKKPRLVAVTHVSEKFELLVDLDVITVPNSYIHSEQLEKFCQQNVKRFLYFNTEINDKNFSNPTRVLCPGDKLHVRAWKQTSPKPSTSEERLEFLATKKAIYTGAQGLSLVFEQRREELPKRMFYSSYDEKARLWKDAGGDHRVPRLCCFVEGRFEFNCGFFEDDSPGGDCLLSFTEF